MSALNEMLNRQICEQDRVCIPIPCREYRFHKTRRWLFDFAWPDAKLAVEVEGAVFVRGRHTRGSGFTQDCEKYNTAVLMGWRVLRFTREHIENGYALETIIKIYNDLE